MKTTNPIQSRSKQSNREAESFTKLNQVNKFLSKQQIKQSLPIHSEVMFINCNKNKNTFKTFFLPYFQHIRLLHLDIFYLTSEKMLELPWRFVKLNKSEKNF